MNIYLVGYRATGKTSVGRRLARRLNRRFVDTDALVEDAAGMPVAEIVSRFGWAGFRERETGVITGIGREKGLVVATGGGTVVHPGNMETLRRTGTVIWLDASVDTILSRMGGDPRTPSLRPPLEGGPSSPAGEVRRTLPERILLYSRAAHMRVCTDDSDVDTICDRIVHSTGLSI